MFASIDKDVPCGEKVQRNRKPKPLRLRSRECWLMLLRGDGFEVGDGEVLFESAFEELLDVLHELRGGNAVEHAVVEAETDGHDRASFDFAVFDDEAFFYGADSDGGSAHARSECGRGTKRAERADAESGAVDQQACGGKGHAEPQRDAAEPPGKLGVECFFAQLVDGIERRFFVHLQLSCDLLDRLFIGIVNDGEVDGSFRSDASFDSDTSDDIMELGTSAEGKVALARDRMRALSNGDCFQKYGGYSYALPALPQFFAQFFSPRHVDIVEDVAAHCLASNYRDEIDDVPSRSVD